MALPFPTLIVEVAFSDGPGVASPTWTDITQYVASGSLQAGRQYELERFNPATLSLTLKARDRRFDPENTTAPPYGAGNIIPMRQIRFRATWNAVTYAIFRGFVTDWGSTIPGPDDDVFVTTITAKDAFAYFEFIKLPGSWLEAAIRKDRPAHWW